ncbi:MAG: A24 family peptidase [Prochlorococcus sp.]
MSDLIWLAIAGACFGSFCNVVVWRLPRAESLIWPGSHCTRCGSNVRWHDNLPLLGWLLLAGRCRDCRQPISARYPSVEALSAGLWVSAAVAATAGLTALPTLFRIAAGVVLVSILLPLVLIDLDHMWLPEPICRLGLLLGLSFTTAAALLLGWDPGAALLLNHLIGAAAALLILEWLSALAERLLGQPALGLGDAKLAALGGGWLGLGGIGLAMALAVLTGALFGLAGRLTGRLQSRQAFPFGPFIAIGIWAVWLCGNDWWWALWLNLTGTN